MGIRIFTPSAARRSLESIRPAAEGMARLYREMERRRPAVGGGDRPVDRQYFVMARRLATAMDLLRRVGVRIRDPRIGLIEFPARRAGRAVALCWRVGEPSVGFWYEIEEGHGGRRPVDDDGPWESDAPVDR